MPAELCGQGVDFFCRRSFGEFDDDLVADHFNRFKHPGLSVGENLDFLLHTNERIFTGSLIAGSSKQDSWFLGQRFEGPVEKLPVWTAGRRLRF